MKALSELTRRIALGLNVVSGVLLVGIMLITLADVATRAMFAATSGSVDLTFRGSVELISYGLLYMVLLTFPHSVRQAQVIVEMFTERLGRRANDLLEGVYTIGLALLAGTMSWRLYETSHAMVLSGETTQDLAIPLSTIYTGASAACAVLALRCVLVAAELIVARVAPAPAPEAVADGLVMKENGA